MDSQKSEIPISMNEYDIKFLYSSSRCQAKPFFLSIIFDFMVFLFCFFDKNSEVSLKCLIRITLVNLLKTYNFWLNFNSISVNIWLIKDYNNQILRDFQGRKSWNSD